MKNMIAFGKDELVGKPLVHAGDKIKCPRCGKRHKLEAGINTKTGKPSELLLFYRCGKSSYLAAVDNARIV